MIMNVKDDTGYCAIIEVRIIFKIDLNLSDEICTETGIREAYKYIRLLTISEDHINHLFSQTPEW